MSFVNVTGRAGSKRTRPTDVDAGRVFSDPPFTTAVDVGRVFSDPPFTLMATCEFVQQQWYPKLPADSPDPSSTTACTMYSPVSLKLAVVVAEPFTSFVRGSENCTE